MIAQQRLKCVGCGAIILAGDMDPCPECGGVLLRIPQRPVVIESGKPKSFASRYAGPAAAVLVVLLGVAGFFGVRKIQRDATQRQAEYEIKEAAFYCREPVESIKQSCLEWGRAHRPDDEWDGAREFAELMQITCGKKLDK